MRGRVARTPADALKQEWVHKHYKCLTPLVTSAAEALVAQFHGSFVNMMPTAFQLNVAQFTRLLMRDPELCVPTPCLLCLEFLR